MTQVSKSIQNMVEQVIGHSLLAVGKIVKHPDGRQVKIMSGQYWGEYGISNFWEWREVKKDGTLGKLEKGYGW